MAAKQVGDRSSGDSSRAYTPRGEEETIVGFEEEVLIIKEQLTGVPKQLDVISIVGMPGIGKTTLAIKVYNDPLVAYHFHIRAWITISQEYVKRDLLCGLLSSVMHHRNGVDQISDEKVNQMIDKELAQRLYKSLKGRRYFIVMDDIWDSRVWSDLKTCFPNDNNGSRIMFTSRHEDVALLAKSSKPPLSLRFLTDDESWVLFQQKVFRRETCPSKLTRIGKHIAKKCQGIPLVIVVVAGILTNEEKSPDQWKKVGKTVNSQMTTDPQIWVKTLALSYNHLPHHLKLCFLYFGLFPEDYQVPVWKLIWLWMAEGLIRETGKKNLEDVAEEYLMELIGRSLVLVSRRRSDGGVKTCCIHDLLRDFCIKQAEKECFLQQNFRELPVSHFAQPKDPFIDDSPSTSITSIFGKSVLHDLDCLLYEFLRVLCINFGFFSSYHGKIGKLVHLRYLEIGIPRLLLSDIYLPTTISNLKNLETLIIYTWSSVTLPYCITGMVSLRHLQTVKRGTLRIKEPSLRHLQTVKRGPLRIKEPGAIYPFSLDNLQTLSYIDASSCSVFLAGTLNIRKLGIRGCIFKDRFITFPDTYFLSHLQELKLWCVQFERFGSWPMSLCGVRFPTNLKKLTLMETRVNWNEMSTLGKKLPNLEVLKLLKFACVGKCWKTSDEDFPQLKFLKLVTISIEEWQVSSNPFPRLQRLVLVRCWGLQSIPSEIGEVPTLQMIEVRDCNTSVANSAYKIKEEQNWLQIVESETGMTGMTRMTRSGGGGGLVWMRGINGSGLILKIGGEAKMSL
ncbi:putative late blight resistance protein homolog R1B-16 isoform X2 [Actinidia eriantha]|uniref:putative late blight resistance protein homolog R1B-16 isoform X2 n=1 Tax=Actinidia eriantha TaxID=165200 RepID=UPI002590924E|nr:putative late blight resistance protein homolog R1B-16 isoform X2 [Actinidia eriantha]